MTTRKFAIVGVSLILGAVLVGSSIGYGVAGCLRVRPADAAANAPRYAVPVEVVGSMDPGWLSKAYLVFDEPGGTAVFGICVLVLGAILTRGTGDRGGGAVPHGAPVGARPRPRGARDRRLGACGRPRVLPLQAPRTARK